MEQVNLLWKGIDRESLEHCKINITAKGADIRSVIIGRESKKNYTAEYHIKTNARWETVLVEVNLQWHTKTKQFSFKSDGKGNWKTGKRTVKKFKGCIDVDLPLTPFTNTLPICRLKLKVGESGSIKVLYLDLTGKGISVKTQKYTRLSKNTYLYQNVPNDFEANLVVGKNGLVKNYPGLFARI